MSSMRAIYGHKKTALANLDAGLVDSQCTIFERLTRRLAAAGAEQVAVTAISGHFCIDKFKLASPLLVIDLVETLAIWLLRRGYKRVGILGTASVMSTGMYGKLASVDVIAPEGPDLQRVHEAYILLARSGRPMPALREEFVSAGSEMIGRGAEAVLLGGTDLNAIFTEADEVFPIVDCARVHIDEIARRILRLTAQLCWPYSHVLSRDCTCKNQIAPSTAGHGIEIVTTSWNL